MLIHCITYANSTFEVQTNFFLKNKQFNNRIDFLLGKVSSQSKTSHESFDTLRHYLKNLYTLSKLTHMFEYTPPTVIDFAKKIYPDIFYLWYDALHDNTHSNTFIFERLEDISASLTLLHASTIKQHKKKITILFSFQGDFCYEGFLKQQAKKILNESIHDIHFLNKGLSELLLTESQPNLLVCNYYVPNAETIPYKVIVLPLFPTTTDWKILQQELQKLYNELVLVTELT